MRKIIPPIERVMRKIVIDKLTSCWNFTGALNEKGYGIVGLGSRGSGNDKAHRIVFSHFVSPIPDGLFVCHRCDNPSCCNPDHLFLGTNLDNVRDMVSKKRNSKPPFNDHIKGVVHVGHKLNDDKVREMRVLRESGYSLVKLASIFNIADSTVYRICNRESWKHVQ